MLLKKSMCNGRCASAPCLTRCPAVNRWSSTSSSSAPGRAACAAAIHLKQRSPELGVVVVEKGSEVGAHILSGAVIDPDRARPPAAGMAQRRHADQDQGHRRPLLLARPVGRHAAAELHDAAADERTTATTSRRSGNVCRWLATKAEALGVEIYPGFAATEVLLRRTRRGGRRRHRRHGHRQGRRAARQLPPRGMELRAKYTLFAEGARGSLRQALHRDITGLCTAAASRRSSASA